MNRETLLALLVEHSYQYKVGGFRLVSGAVSDEYLDCRRALGLPLALAAVGKLCLDALRPDIASIGGLTMGADPIAIATALQSAGTEHPVSWFSVRKEAKGHGQKRLIEGQAASPVAVVDDVVTSGGSTLEAIRRCREAGLAVAQVLVLVDREEQEGMEKIRAEVGEGVPVTALFTKRELREAWLRTLAC
jgi:orotate phosphoribosyltransferase